MDRTARNGEGAYVRALHVIRMKQGSSGDLAARVESAMADATGSRKMQVFMVDPRDSQFAQVTCRHRRDGSRGNPLRLAAREGQRSTSTTQPSLKGPAV